MTQVMEPSRSICAISAPCSSGWTNATKPLMPPARLRGPAAGLSGIATTTPIGYALPSEHANGIALTGRLPRTDALRSQRCNDRLWISAVTLIWGWHLG